MTSEEFELIKSIVDKDIKEEKIEDINKILDYLKNASNRLKKVSEKKSLIFENEIIEKNSSIIFKQIYELKDLGKTDEEKVKIQRFLNFIDRSIHKIAEKANFPEEAKENTCKYKFDIRYFCIGHLIQLAPEDLKSLRGVGQGSIEIINDILKENDLSLGMVISDKDCDIINEIIKENVRIKMECEKEESYKKNR